MDSASPLSKRLRLDAETEPFAGKRKCCSTPSTAVVPFSEETLEPASSVAEILSVPLSVIFREAPQPILSASQQRRRKPLLSRAEAQTFLTITMLAQEMDSLVSASAAAFTQKLAYKSFSRRVQNVDHPFLRPLLPLLHVLSDQVPGESLLQIQNELNRVVADLQAAAFSLRQFSEQNWTLSESLMDAGTNGSFLAEQKKHLSDIQEETCNRIDALLQNETISPPSASTTSSVVSGDKQTSDGCSMKEYCERVLKFDEEGEKEATFPSPDSNPPLHPTGSIQQSLASVSKASVSAVYSPSPFDERSGTGLPHQSLALNDNSSPLPDPPQEPTTQLSHGKTDLPLEKENVSSQEPQLAQGRAYDVIYGSQTSSVASSQSCRIGSATMSAAEMLSILATSTPPTKGIR
jgi:hypothetical protein